MQRLLRLDLGAVIIGLIILAVGIYYVLVNTFGIALPELNGDAIWPIAVVALGIGILWSALGRMNRGGHGPQGV
jgi:hypothetical protein